MMMYGQPDIRSDADRLAMAGRCVHTTLGRLREFPCRMDEMTEREAKIAGMVCELVGTLQFLGSVLPEPEPEPPQPPAGRVAGEGEGVGHE